MKGSSSSPISTKTNSTKDVTKGKVVTETTMIKGKVVVKPKATSDDRRKSTGFDGWAAFFFCGPPSFGANFKGPFASVSLNGPPLLAPTSKACALSCEPK